MASSSSLMAAPSSSSSYCSNTNPLLPQVPFSFLFFFFFWNTSCILTLFSYYSTRKPTSMDILFNPPIGASSSIRCYLLLVQILLLSPNPTEAFSSAQGPPGLPRPSRLKLTSPWALLSVPSLAIVVVSSLLSVSLLHFYSSLFQECPFILTIH